MFEPAGEGRSLPPRNVSTPHIAGYRIVIIPGGVTGEYKTPARVFAIRRRTGRVWTVVPPSASGEIGRRARFRFWCPRTWGFKSPLAHSRPGACSEGHRAIRPAAVTEAGPASAAPSRPPPLTRIHAERARGDPRCAQFDGPGLLNRPAKPIPPCSRQRNYRTRRPASLDSFDASSAYRLRPPFFPEVLSRNISGDRPAASPGRTMYPTGVE